MWGAGKVKRGLCCGLAQERIFEDLCKELNEEIHLLIHSIHSVIMKFLIMCSVWYFALRKNGDHDTVPSIKDLRGPGGSEQVSGEACWDGDRAQGAGGAGSRNMNLVSESQGGLSGGGDV